MPKSSAPTRLAVRKTYKLYIGGAFPRSESGRTYLVKGDNVALASRKDVRDAVTAARKAQAKWAGATAYNRGQILYRAAEMLEGRRKEFTALGVPAAEVEAATDRLVWYAGWSDKIAQVTGAANPVAGPFFNLSAPEPTGVVGVVAPASLLGLVSVIAPVIVGTVVALAAVVVVYILTLPRVQSLPEGYTYEYFPAGGHRYIIAPGGIKRVGQEVLDYQVNGTTVDGTVRLDLGGIRIQKFHLDLKTHEVTFQDPWR